MTHEPFVIREFIAVVIGWHNIHQENVFGFGVQPGDLHFEAGKHAPVDENGTILQQGSRKGFSQIITTIVIIIIQYI